MRPKSLLAVALALAVPAAASCGDEEKPSKEEWIKDVDEICAKYDKRIEDVGREELGAGKPTPEEVSKFARTVTPIQRRELDEIRHVERPEGEHEKISEILAAADDGRKKLVDAGDDPAVAKKYFLDEEEDPFAEADKRARAYGLKKCGAQG